MATYNELLQASANDDLNARMRVAVIIACEAIRTEVDTTPNHAARLAWARQTLANPEFAARQMIWAVLAQNAGFTLAQITGATDAALQTAVNAAVNLLAG